MWPTAALYGHTKSPVHVPCISVQLCQRPPAVIAARVWPGLVNGFDFIKSSTPTAGLILILLCPRLASSMSNLVHGVNPTQSSTPAAALVHSTPPRTPTDAHAYCRPLLKSRPPPSVHAQARPCPRPTLVLTCSHPHSRSDLVHTLDPAQPSTSDLVHGLRPRLPTPTPTQSMSTVEWPF